MITFIKFLTWLASPIGLLTWLSLIALGLRLLNKAPRTRLLFSLIAIIQLLFFATPVVSNRLNDGLDAKARQLETQNKGGPYAAIVLLGGMIDYDPLTGTVNFGNTVDRLWYAAELYRHGLSDKIIVSGGNEIADRYPNAPTQAHLMRNALIKLGVPDSAIILEPEALTTRQHMPLVKALFQDKQLHGRLAIVTSANHMPRAMMNAQEAGLVADACPTDWAMPLSSRTLLNQWLPRSKYLLESELAIKEWVGLMMQY